MEREKRLFSCLRLLPLAWLLPELETERVGGDKGPGTVLRDSEGALGLALPFRERLPSV